MTTRRRLILTSALLPAVASLAFTALPGAAEPKETADRREGGGTEPQLMFVQTADDLRADDKTLRLVNVARQTVYFSDRPVRIAGHISLGDYLEEWTAAAGPNNFAKDPPNATLSVYEGGKTENILTVVEISDPRVEGTDLVYHYKLIEGPMPESGGATALFIDWIGPGGGVGVGFHGVGAGTRGVGLFGGYGGPRR